MNYNVEMSTFSTPVHFLLREVQCYSNRPKRVTLIVVSAKLRHTDEKSREHSFNKSF